MIGAGCGSSGDDDEAITGTLRTIPQLSRSNLGGEEHEEENDRGDATSRKREREEKKPSEVWEKLKEESEAVAARFLPLRVKPCYVYAPLALARRLADLITESIKRSITE